MFTNKVDKSKPLISVVIPVYNKAPYLTDCFESLISQRKSCTDFEVVLIDDGSTDDSFEKCVQFANHHGFVSVFSQENQGVSSARNNGIKQAKGEFILFLDADDSISGGSLKHLTQCIEQFGGNTDVIAYRMCYYYPKSGKTKYHKRDEWFTKTGLYPLDEYPFVAQSTMNVCVRNRGEEMPLFDQSIRMGEDQLFVTQNLERKGVIGYCAEASYKYVRDGSNSSSRLNNPLYAYNDMIRLYSYLLELAGRVSKMRKYATQLILYNFAWRIESSMLFPTHFTGDNCEHQLERLDAIAREIPPAEIADSPYLDEYHKAMLLCRYNMFTESRSVSYKKDCTMVPLSDGTWWKTDVPALIVERCVKTGSQLHFKARFVCPAFITGSEFTAAVRVNGQPLSIEMGASSFSRMSTYYITGKATSIEFEIDLNKIQSAEVAFSLSADGCEIPSIEIDNESPVANARARNGSLIFANATIRVRNDKLVINRTNQLTCVFKNSVWDICDPRIAIRRLIVRAASTGNGSAPIWMYSDLPTSPNEGNAFYQLLHDLQTDDGVNRYYVSNFKIQLEAKYPVLKGKVVACKSREHQTLSLQAELFLCSYLERFTYLPMKKSTYSRLADLTSNHRLVYLQHGILHAHMPWYFSYDRHPIDYVVVSTQFEVDNLTKNYCYPQDSIIVAGAPRLCTITPKDGLKKRIAYVPSWRNYLVSGNAIAREADEGAFESSSFYRGAAGLLNLLSESAVLNNNGWTLDLKLHPNFSMYANYFERWSNGIRLMNGELNPADYDLVITDFSSYLYDFVYAGCDVLYFLPDYKEFYAGLNHYSKLDLPFEEGFGPFCKEETEAHAYISDYVQGKVEQEYLAGFRNKSAEFFLHKDGKNADRLYESLRNISGSIRV